MLRKKIKIFNFTAWLLLLIFLFLPRIPAVAESLSGPNYTIENPAFDAGGGQSTSSVYGVQSEFGDNGDASSSSANYKTQPGFLPGVFPGVPGQPTLTNTGGTLYNSLDFTINQATNASDVNYAIAISPDNFTTTYFIQSDLTIATSTVWQTYLLWSGGGRVTGLSASTTYQIKVKARYGAHSETAYSLTASASTTNPTFAMTITGVSSGTFIAGATTTVSSTATAIDYGSLVPNITAVAAQKITITTNASGGFKTTLQQDGNLSSSAGYQISPVSGSNAVPAAFPGSVTTGAFGYHSTDATLCTGNATRFSSDDTYAQATTQPLEVVCSAAPVSALDTYLVYKVLVGSLQQSSVYSNKITYISTGSY